MTFSDILAFSGMLFGALCGLVLIVYPKSRTTPNLFLGISVMCLTHALLASWLNLTGRILQVPFLIRTGHLSVYLIFPFMYFFYNGVFRSERGWKPWYYLLFIPSLFYLVEFFPFFLLSGEEKVRIFASKLNDSDAMFQVNEGLLGWDNFHFVFRTIWSSYFLILIGRMLWQFRSDFQDFNSPEDHRFYRRMVILWGIFIVVLTIPALLHLLVDYEAYSTSFILISLAVTLILITLNLFFNPRLLYGDYWKFEDVPEGEVAEPTTEVPGTSRIAPKEETKTLQKLNSYMKAHAPYLKRGYTIHQLAQETQIPAYRISHVINQADHRNFSSWINAFRVAHFISMVQEETATRYTLDSIARDCGFGSRASLINSFKLEKGVTPGHYIRQQKSKPQ